MGGTKIRLIQARIASVLHGVIREHLDDFLRAAADRADGAERGGGRGRARMRGRMQLIAAIQNPTVIQRILAHLGLPGARDGPPPPWSKIAAGAEQPPLPDVTV